MIDNLIPLKKVYKITLMRDYSDVLLEEFPVKFITQDTRLLGVIALFFGASFVFIPIAYLIKTWIDREPIGPTLGLLVVGLLFLPLLWLGLKLITKKKELIIDPAFIFKQESHLFKKELWQEPICAYRGIMFRTNVELTGDGHADLGYIVELWHDDPAKTIPIFRSLQYAPAFASWEYYCRVFILPPMERVGKDRYIQRDLQTIALPLMQLVKQNPTLMHAAPPSRPSYVQKFPGKHTETIELPDYTEIELGETSFTIRQKSILANKVTFNYAQVQGVVIDYSKVYTKWAWAVVILVPVPSVRIVIAHDQQYELLNWLQYYLIDKIIKKLE